jgi:hypothetical protein
MKMLSQAVRENVVFIKTIFYQSPKIALKTVDDNSI